MLIGFVASDRARRKRHTLEMLRNYESRKMSLQDIILDCDIVSIGDALAEALIAKDKHLLAQFFKVIDD